jgi:hypothetical protein
VKALFDSGQEYNDVLYCYERVDKEESGKIRKQTASSTLISFELRSYIYKASKYDTLTLSAFHPASATNLLNFARNG